MSALKAGAVSISAEAEGIKTEKKYVIAANPVTNIALAIKEDVINTGDVIHLNATARNANTMITGFSSSPAVTP